MLWVFVRITKTSSLWGDSQKILAELKTPLLLPPLQLHLQPLQITPVQVVSAIHHTEAKVSLTLDASKHVSTFFLLGCYSTSLFE